MCGSGRGSALLGILILALGVIWLLNNFGVTHIDVGDLFATYWPLFLIIWGLDALTRGFTCSVGGDVRKRRSCPGNLTGWFLLVAGIAILGRNIGLYELDLSVFWKVFWPVVIILIGWNLLRTASSSGGAHWAVMSGIELKTKGWNLKDGSFVAFMGGVDMDLTVAHIPEGETILDLTAIMGGIDVRVPSDLHVECEGTAILGGITVFDEEAGGVIASRRFEHKGAEGSPRKIRVRARTLMGGIEIKGYTR
ncbi:MAG TPA: cell wall-active antibiotics response protein [Firmicutes bacterium]|nr:cell wall-active antibiotics response protein [Bacillota bacterium]